MRIPVVNKPSEKRLLAQLRFEDLRYPRISLRLMECGRHRAWKLVAEWKPATRLDEPAKERK